MFVGNISSKEGKVDVPGQFSKSVVIGLVEELGVRNLILDNLLLGANITENHEADSSQLLESH